MSDPTCREVDGSWRSAIIRTVRPATDDEIEHWQWQQEAIAGQKANP